MIGGKFLIISLLLLSALSAEARTAITKCEKSETIVYGVKTTEKICSGDLIFEDTFENLDLSIWEIKNSLDTDDEFQFQWYTNNRSNLFTVDGQLNIRPSLTADDFGEVFLYKGTIDLKDQCSNECSSNCKQSGTFEKILRPIKSAHIESSKAFSFKYGKVEINAKMPTGDWLVPTISLSPKNNAYGNWPASGEIVLAQSRGNRELTRNKSAIGVEQVESALHFGPYADLDGALTFERVHKEKGKGFNEGFHRYQIEWDVNKITFSVDDIETGTVKVNKQSFWDKGNFDIRAPGTWNPWQHATKMAPFDQPFYFVINLAVGGKAAFPENIDSEKPWKNDVSSHPQTDFWEAKNSWLPSWKINENKTKDASFLIDYIRVWAL